MTAIERAPTTQEEKYAFTYGTFPLLEQLEREGGVIHWDWIGGAISTTFTSPLANNVHGPR